jgi:hypothetical protein
MFVWHGGTGARPCTAWPSSKLDNKEQKAKAESTAMARGTVGSQWEGVSNHRITYIKARR